MNNPLQTAKQALESANEIIIHLLENHPTARHHRKTGEALRQVNDAIQAIAHAENLQSEKSIENNQANSFRGSPDHIADIGNMVCNWRQPTYDHSDANYWDSDCGESWALAEGTPTENGMKFCHGCGKPIKEHPFVDSEDKQ